MTRRAWLIFGLIVLFGIVPGLTEAGGEAPPAGSRRQAPDFEVADLHGHSLRLSALRGKVVLLDFWATWCPPCVAEIPHFKELYAEYNPQGFELLGLSLDEGGKESVRSFAEKHEIRYPLAMSKDEIVQAYGGIHGIPTTFLIDKKGQVAKRYVGYRSKEEFEQEIQKLLSE